MGQTKMVFEIKQITYNDKKDVEDFMKVNWGSSIIISRSTIYRVIDLNGFLIRESENIIGLITYTIINADCEIISLDSKKENIGIGTKLINKLIETAKEKRCKRIWLVTTNDNTHAIRFYQKRGFEIVTIHRNAINHSRKLKPEIPLVGLDGIPIRHEIEFQMILDEIEG